MTWNRPLAAALVVSALALLTLYPAPEDDDALRRGVYLFQAEGLNLTAGERYEAPFEVPTGLASLNLSYDFEVAVYPHVWVRDPDGRSIHATVVDDELDLDVPWPRGGTWSFHIEADPAREDAMVEDGDVAILGFLPRPGQSPVPA